MSLTDHDERFDGDEWRLAFFGDERDDHERDQMLRDLYWRVYDGDFNTPGDRITAKNTLGNVWWSHRLFSDNPAPAPLWATEGDLRAMIQWVGAFVIATKERGYDPLDVSQHRPPNPVFGDTGIERSVNSSNDGRGHTVVYSLAGGTIASALFGRNRGVTFLDHDLDKVTKIPLVEVVADDPATYLEYEEGGGSNPFSLPPEWYNDDATRAPAYEKYEEAGLVGGESR